MERDDLLKDLDIQKALFGLFFSFDNRLQQAGDHFYEEITCKQFFLLACLSLFQQPPSIGELSEIMGSSHQNVKQIVLKLEKLGFVEVFGDSLDRRKLLVKVGKRANELSQKYAAQEMAFIKALYDGLSKEEIKVTFNTMSKIEANLIKIKGDKR